MLIGINTVQDISSITFSDDFWCQPLDKTLNSLNSLYLLGDLHVAANTAVMLPRSFQVLFELLLFLPGGCLMNILLPTKSGIDTHKQDNNQGSCLKPQYQHALIKVVSITQASKTIFGEICVLESQTVLRISVLCCQIAIDFFTKTSPKRFATKESSPSLSEGILRGNF